MKKYLLVMILMLQAQTSFSVEVFSRARERAAAAKETAQKYWTELRSLRACWVTKSCTDLQRARIKELGKKAGGIALLMSVVAVLAGLGVRSRKASMEPTVQNAVRRFKVDVYNPSTGFNDLRLLELVEQGQQAHEEARSFITGVQERFSIQGLEAVQWIADEKRDRAMYNFATELIEKQKSERIKQEAILRGKFVEKAESIIGTQPISGG